MLDDKTNIGIIWPSDQLNAEFLINEIRKKNNIISSKSIFFSQGLTEFIYDVYFFDLDFKVRAAKSINQKISRLISRENNSVLVIFYKSNTFEDTINVRDDIRLKFQKTHEGPAFDIMHCASSIQEREYLCSLISKNNIQSYKERIILSYNLFSKLKKLHLWAGCNDIDMNDICVAGSAVFDLYNYIHCDDIDIILPDKIRDAKYGKGSKKLCDDIDIVKKGYFQRNGLSKNITDTELVYDRKNHVVATGTKFVNLSYVLERKKLARRPKDLKHLSKYHNNFKVKNIEYKDPSFFLNKNRYDIICKYIFFSALINNSSDNKVVRDCYEKHIYGRKRNGEDGGKFIDDQPIKYSYNDYYDYAVELLKSLQTNGFKEEYAIPYYDNNIENGAHRIACSLALGIDKIPCFKISTIKKPKPWGKEWFVQKKFPRFYIDMLDKCYKALTTGKIDK